MKNTLYISILIIFSTVLFINKVAFAALTCTYSPAGPAYVTVNLPSSLSIPVGTIVGTTLWSSTTGTTTSLLTTCNTSWYPVIAYAPNVSMAATNVENVYATNVPGIGIRVKGYNKYMPAPGNALNALGGTNSYAATGVRSYLSFGIDIVLTGPVGSGILTLQSPLAGGYANNNPTSLGNAFPYGLLKISGATNISLPSCTASNVNVIMGDHARSEFSDGIGATTTSTPFQITLNCPGNWNNILYEIDPGTSIVAGTTSVVTLDGSSTATGIGIQLLDSSDSPMTAEKGFGLGSSVPLGSVPGSNAYDTSVAASYTIPLNARYYRTDTTISPGSANTFMTFTLTYQ